MNGLICRMRSLAIALLAVGVLGALIGCQGADEANQSSAAPDASAGSPSADAGLAVANATVSTTPHTDEIPVDSDAVTAGEGTPGENATADEASDGKLKTVPTWIADAVFYQIFPERFCNGDPSNDPTHDSLESPELVPDSWAITPWTSDWYSRADWEKEAGDNFYDNGVFNRRFGGDLQGVIDKLDYLTDLGINAIYFNPVFYGRSLHKYDGNALHHIDPYFGPDPAGDLKLMQAETSDPASWKWTAADKLFLELLQQAHRRGIHVIIDGVFNHTGRDFFAFADLVKNQENSPYKDWYIVQHFDDPATPHNEFTYKGWWGVETLPEFADVDEGKDLHSGPKQYLMDMTRRWMDPDGDGDPQDGIDGWRLDVANDVPVAFWVDWHALVRKLNPEAYTVAEIWDDAYNFLTSAQFSATMNYHAFAFPVKGYLIDGKLTAHDFGQQLEERLRIYPKSMQYAMQNLVDSHDTDRVASMIVNAGLHPYSQPHRFDYDVTEPFSARNGGDYDLHAPNQRQRRIQRMVALMQMTFVGPPMIYYGTEAGMWGADDPCDRQAMVWPDMTYEDQANDPRGRERTPDPVAFQHSLHQFYRAAIGLRHLVPAMRRGSFKPIASDDAAKFFAFQRRLGDEIIYVAFNRGNDPYQWRPPHEEGYMLRQIFSASGEPEKINFYRDPNGAVVTLPPLEGVVLTRQLRQE